MLGTALAIGSIVTSLAGSYSQYQAQKDQAKAQEIYNNWYREENTKSINQELTTNLKQIQNQYFENLKQTSFQNQLVSNQNLESQRTAEASALESGLSTGSVENLFYSYQRSQAINDYINAQNAKNKGYQLNIDMQSLRNKAQSAINNVSVYDPTSVVKPSLSAAILEATGDAMQIFGNYYTQKQKDKYYNRSSTSFINPIILDTLTFQSSNL